MVAIQPFRFLHTGDLHLDSPFVGLTAAAPPEIATQLREATLVAWGRVVELAIEERVDFVLIAGDAFEHANRSLLAQVRFRDGLARLDEAGIASCVVTGNHDPLSGWEPSIAWPPTAHRFGADDVTSMPVMRDGHEIARVYGISYAMRDVTENLARRFRREPDVPFAIGLLHANVGGQPGHHPYAPCTISDLRASGIDYWALGHVHRPGVLSAAAPVVVYCGNPQGRDTGEAEPRGCWIVDVDRGGVAHPSFVAVDIVRWQLLETAIDDAESEEALVERVCETVTAARDAAGRSIVARVTLVGRGSMHDSLQRPGMLADLHRLVGERLPPVDGRFAWVERVRDATRPVVDLAVAGAPGTFLGELVRQAEEAREAVAAGRPSDTNGDTEDLVASSLSWEEVLDELYGHSRARRLLAGTRPADDRLVELLADAERLAIDRILEAG